MGCVRPVFVRNGDVLEVAIRAYLALGEHRTLCVKTLVTLSESARACGRRGKIGISACIVAVLMMRVSHKVL